MSTRSHIRASWSTQTRYSRSTSLRRSSKAQSQRHTCVSNSRERPHNVRSPPGKRNPRISVPSCEDDGGSRVARPSDFSPR
eukprot:2921493-Prymnesium_polylepis.1